MKRQKLAIGRNRVTFGVVLVVFLLLSTVFSGCTPVSQPVTVTDFALDTVVSVTVYKREDRTAAEEAIALCKRYESLFSRTLSTSDLYRLNHSEGEITEIREELFDVLTASLLYSETFGNWFDVTLGAVSDLYDFKDGTKAPDEESVNQALTHTGASKVHLLSYNSVSIDDPELVIDLGAVAKGYIADQMSAFLREKNVSSALINLGGNVLAVGSKPDGSDFTVGIKDPRTDGGVLTALSVSSNSVVTSGNYERCFTVDGKLYHHLIDPKTGFPAETGLVSVTVVSESSMLSDILSTMFYVAGMENARTLIRNFPGVTAYFVDSSYEITIVR